MRQELTQALAKRPGRESIGAFVLLETPFSPEDGTLTRTMKARRDAIFAKYSAEVAQVGLYLLYWWVSLSCFRSAQQAIVLTGKSSSKY